MFWCLVCLMSVTGAFLKAIGKDLEYSLCIILQILVHLVLQGSPSLRGFFVTIEQNVCDICCLGSASNHEVLFQPLPVECLCCMLVLSVPVHRGNHVCRYVNGHPGFVLLIWLNQLQENISFWEGVVVILQKQRLPTDRLIAQMR